MHKLLQLAVGVVCAGAVMLAHAPTAAGAPDNFEGTFKVNFGHSDVPPPCNLDFCFEGSLAGHGKATLSGIATSVTPIAGTQCAAERFRATIELGDGTIGLGASGTACSPGSSASTLGSQVSYGNPGKDDGTFTATGGTGAYAGASGSGEFHSSFAGDVRVSSLHGTLVLP